MTVASDIFLRLLILVDLLSPTFLVGLIIYQLFSGKSLLRGWCALNTRKDNPMLFWSSIGVQIMAALVAFYHIFVAVFMTYV
jgi:ABC-type tungstate transport system substrate-binding protein